ncbi:MAG: DUF4878 domain-containing protein [Bacteroidetes bacterium]|nr:MAG: DUF4878 domain-containing protein [Bacteroidota bacterium]
MKKIRPVVFFLLLLTSCNNPDKDAKENKSDNDLDAARNFLEAALKGDYKLAARYMVQDSTNIGYLDVTERRYNRMDVDEKRNLRNASLRFYDPLLQNDSTTITVFSNSYKNDKDTLKIVKQDGQWLVDLKYLFEHDLDTSLNKPVIDTIHK